MAVLSDTLGRALSQFQVDDRTTVIENDVPVIVQLEGQNLQKLVTFLPVDQRPAFADVFVEATKHLIESYSGLLAYSHASEVSLLLCIRDKQRKTTGTHGDLSVSVASTLAAALVYFAQQHTPPMLFNQNSRLVLPQFLARSFAFPSEEVAAKFFLWRESVARKSSMEALALKHFSANKLAGKSSIDRKAMLAEKGVDYDSLSEHVRRGTFIRRYRTEKLLDPLVLEKIPEAYRPRKQVLSMTIERVADVPPLAVIENLRDFVFDNAGPVVADRPFATAITV